MIPMDYLGFLRITQDSLGFLNNYYGLLIRIRRNPQESPMDSACPADFQEASQRLGRLSAGFPVCDPHSQELQDFKDLHDFQRFVQEFKGFKDFLYFLIGITTTSLGITRILENRKKAWEPQRILENPTESLRIPEIHTNSYEFLIIPNDS